ncbi:hypothetical protein EIN_177960 [Entamoeba invadens IP1]|uniref:hypothetical protein n=1 Tax=Entamoeba invadens IP1 TaxID=370355 RepID=UPI0002C3E4E1|nr:hypothetical protein EIN_177960 [Entamoeba invadens IP1]ELP93889.1 hypothetical protein EIN_177960 [Entamoeba invadens IP1]|eukprot:XP_004260660.1 hypothetical protein EIN_177960 [Entamoeba invadens IP1]
MSTIGCMIDVDGVLVRDGKEIEGASEGIKMLERAQVPFVLVTNGHGNSEYKSSLVSKALRVTISPEQTLLAVTPLIDLLDKYQDKGVMVVGKKPDYDTIANFGYQKIAFYEDFATTCPSEFPDYNAKTSARSVVGSLSVETPIEAIFVMHTPLNWGEAIQIICDILRSKSRTFAALQKNETTNEQQIPIFVCNPDFDYAGQFPLPRLTVGAFCKCLQAIWCQMSGKELEVTYYGKPYKTIYEKAEHLLHEKNSKITRFYGIGDNPVSDIRGANNMKKESKFEYKSVLVESGCSSKKALAMDIPDVTTTSFLEAVRTILEENGITTIF